MVRFLTWPSAREARSPSTTSSLPSSSALLPSTLALLSTWGLALLVVYVAILTSQVRTSANDNLQFDSSLAGTTCGSFESSVQSYCDSADPYCCSKFEHNFHCLGEVPADPRVCLAGSDTNVHNGYVSEYGSQALSFVNNALASSPSTC